MLVYRRVADAGLEIWRHLPHLRSSCLFPLIL
jgi:hypothetical protein